MITLSDEGVPKIETAQGCGRIPLALSQHLEIWDASSSDNQTKFYLYLMRCHD